MRFHVKQQEYGRGSCTVLGAPTQFGLMKTCVRSPIVDLQKACKVHSIPQAPPAFEAALPPLLPDFFDFLEGGCTREEVATQNSLRAISCSASFKDSMASFTAA